MLVTVKRLLISLVLGLVIASLGLLLVPSLGRLAAPFVCQGSLEPETRLHGLHFRCVEAADGRIKPVPTTQVVLYTLPLLAVALLFPVSTLLSEAERRTRSARGTMHADLAAAITARAEVLRIVRRSSISRQALMRAAELTLTLWVYPPNGRPYEAKVSWLVEDESLSRLMVGSVVQVRINPRRPEAVYPDQPWAHYAWWS